MCVAGEKVLMFFFVKKLQNAPWEVVLSLSLCLLSRCVSPVVFVTSLVMPPRSSQRLYPCTSSLIMYL